MHWAGHTALGPIVQLPPPPPPPRATASSATINDSIVASYSVYLAIFPDDLLRWTFWALKMASISSARVLISAKRFSSR
jgi:hypothetical protein